MLAFIERKRGRNYFPETKNRLTGIIPAKAALHSIWREYIGRMITERQQREGWGTGVLRRLACDLKSELAEVKGFSERNLKRMIQLYREYPQLSSIAMIH